MSTYPFSTALVTGASSGIGEAMVELLSAAGVHTVVVARRGDRLADLAARCAGVEVLVADLTTSEGLAAVVARVSDVDRPIDLVVNNAGFGTSGEFHTLDADRLEREISLNVQALTRIAHAALKVMQPRGRGWLINVSSVASFQPAPKLAVYAATKAYVTNLTESLHEEAKRSGVHVTALCPGITRTEFQSVSNADEYTGKYPAFVWMESEAVARTALHDVVRNKTLSVPGWIYRVLVALVDFLPRNLVRRLSSLAQR
jgi:short-subunit dehydrogenase